MAQKRKEEPADTLAELQSLGDRFGQWVGANPLPVLAFFGAILLLAGSILCQIPATAIVRFKSWRIYWREHDTLAA